MTDTPSLSQESQVSNRSPVLYIAIYAALVSAIATLVIQILGLIKHRRADTSIEQVTEPVPQTTPVQGRLPEAQADSSILSAPANRWRLSTKYVVGVGLFLVLLFVVFLSRSSLALIILAALLAFVVQPVTGFFQRRLKLNHGASIALAYLLVVLLLILVPMLFIPSMVKSVNGFLSVDWETIGRDLAVTLEAAAQNLSSTPVIGAAIASTLEAAAQLLSSAASLETPAPIVVDVSTTSMGNRLASTLGRLASILGPLVSAVTSLVFMLLISLRMSLGADEMRLAYPKLVPPSYNDEIVDLVERILNVWSSFLRGQLSLMVIMGVLTYLLNLVLGTPYALFLGFLSGLLEIIPNLGPVLAAIPAVLLALIFGSSYLPFNHLIFAILLILGYLLLSGLENQVIVPKVLGEAVSLHPLVVIIGVVVGGASFGLLGVFLATPVISTGKEIFGYLYNKILEPPPESKPLKKKLSFQDTLKEITGRIRLALIRRKQPSSGVQQPPE